MSYLEQSFIQTVQLLFVFPSTLLPIHCPSTGTPSPFSIPASCGWAVLLPSRCWVHSSHACDTFAEEARALSASSTPQISSLLTPSCTTPFYNCILYRFGGFLHKAAGSFKQKKQITLILD